MSLLLKGASNKYGIFPYVITISILAVLFAGFATYMFTGGDKISTAIFTSIVAAFIIIVLLISRELWMESKSKFRVRMATIGIALTTIIAYTGWQQTIQDILAKYLHIENLGNAVHPAIVFSFAAFVIFIINYFNRDNTAMGIHPNPIDIPVPDFISRMVSVTEALTDDLRSIDKATNWSIQFFTDLDAEVELRSEGNEAQKKVTDLLKAIKSMKKERLFLVLGDPGSGKSVALRKLCRELASEVAKTQKIPVYINLKEWQVEQKWNENNPPTVEQLNAFVLKNLKSGDIAKIKFFEKYYDALYENGQLYFVFDSFDEIPSVLDEKDKSPLIQELSKVMFKFLKGARQDSQGILSSRIFRKPTEDFQTQTTLEIRPFSDDKITQTLRRDNQFSAELLNQLFKERTDLVPVARNPFMAALLANYAENNNNELPRNQSDLYESYIRNALKTCQDLIKKRGLTEGGIVQCAIAMADEMFRGEKGLEAPIKDLKQKLDIQNLEEVIEVLKSARIGRVGTGDENMFSFTHRRFCEYFVVQKLLQENRAIDLNDIPEDSKLRDALVLYCEVADEAQSKKIANFCWDIIKNSTNPYDLRVIHCLRFLQDAFKGRLECIADFREELTEYVLSRINTDNIIITKLAVESLGLLEDKDIEKGVVQAFDLQNEWINETAFKACRHLDEIEPKTQSRVANYIYNLTIWYIFKRYKEVSFSLKLTKAFDYAYKCLHFKVMDLVGIVAFFCLSIIIYLTSFPNMEIVNENYFIKSTQNDIIIKNLELNLLTLDESKDTTKIASINDKIHAEYNKFFEWYDIYKKERSISKLHNFCYFIVIVTLLIAFLEFYFLEDEFSKGFLLWLFKPGAYLGLFLYFILNLMADLQYNTFLVIVLIILLFCILNFRYAYLIFKDLSKTKFSLKSIIHFSILSFIKMLSYLILIMPQIFNEFISTFKDLKKIRIGHILIGLYFIGFIAIGGFERKDEQGLPKMAIYYLSPMIVFVLSMLFFFVFLFFKTKYIDHVFFKTINFNKCHNRSYISDIYLKLRTRRYKKRFLTHLENNVREATGVWADSKILMLDNSEETIRLAKLEEKWLGLNK